MYAKKSHAAVNSDWLVANTTTYRQNIGTHFGRRLFTSEGAGAWGQQIVTRKSNGRCGIVK